LFQVIDAAVTDVGKYFFFNQKANCTMRINAGTSTKGPMTPAKACPE
jgi:hypothetical protein